MKLAEFSNYCKLWKYNIILMDTEMVFVLPNRYSYQILTEMVSIATYTSSLTYQWLLDPSLKSEFRLQ